MLTRDTPAAWTDCWRGGGPGSTETLVRLGGGPGRRAGELGAGSLCTTSTWVDATCVGGAGATATDSPIGVVSGSGAAGCGAGTACWWSTAAVVADGTSAAADTSLGGAGASSSGGASSGIGGASSSGGMSSSTVTGAGTCAEGSVVTGTSWKNGLIAAGAGLVTGVRKGLASGAAAVRCGHVSGQCTCPWVCE